MKNVIVLGGSYSGSRAAELLSKSLPKDYRVILIDKRSHFAHIYKFGRSAVVPGKAHTLFVPYTNLLQAPSLNKDSCPRTKDGKPARHLVVQASVIKILENAVQVDQDVCNIVDTSDTPFNLDQCCRMGGSGCCGEFSKRQPSQIPFSFLVYALGSHLPPPISTHALTKKEGVSFLKVQQGLIFSASSILVIGGGALGIQFATDIKEHYPDKKVTLIHSRARLLPLFDQALHDETIKRFEELGIEYILEDRVILPSKLESAGWLTLQTQKGRTLASDLRIFSTGQKPNSQVLQKYSPGSIDDHGFVKVNRHMQVLGHENIFAAGDVIDGFGAIKAGHTGWNQATIAAENIEKMIKSYRAGVPAELTEYFAGKPMIRLSLGLKRSVTQMICPEDDSKLKIEAGEHADDDASWQIIWQSFKVPYDDPHQ